MDAPAAVEPPSPDELWVEVDGTRYPFPANFTFWEARWVKQLTGLAMGDFIAAGLRSDPDTTYAYAAVALLRAPDNALSAVQIQRVLDEKALGTVRVVQPEEATDDGPPEPAADGGDNEGESPTRDD